MPSAQVVRRESGTRSPAALSTTVRQNTGQGWVRATYLSRRNPSQVARWGSSLAVRLPAAVVEALGLKEGDEIDIRVVGQRAFEVEPDSSRERALALIRSLRKPLPPAWKFDREEANAR
jgi:antitoxin MazE